MTRDARHDVSVVTVTMMNTISIFGTKKPSESFLFRFNFLSPAYAKNFGTEKIRTVPAAARRSRAAAAGTVLIFSVAFQILYA